ncbi:unnamed protein product [Protopolystoma xenopodis]|uniref:Uncharacterized protein n=1 Tax=Protopolystoma xenopodis TaxID=117903 RepID=A0A448WF99_9PLAT|nr:unnamed protein product [Protopolystoma xenopodis]
MIGRVLFDSDTPGESDATSGNSSLGLLPTVRRAVAGTTIEEEEVDEASTASTTGPSAAVSTVESAAYRPGVISAGTGNGSAKAGFNNGRLCTMADLSRLNPSLAAAVAQISGETGTSTADLVAGLAEVRRRPTDARNRLRRLGGVGSPSGQSSHGLSLTPTSKTNTAIASAGAGAGQVGDSASAGISKRLSLPASMNLPPHLWPRATRFLGETMTRRERRLSLVSQFA